MTTCLAGIVLAGCTTAGNSDKELIEMYEYIHSKNNRINDELDYIKESSQRNDLLNRLKDEDMLLCIPCIKEYIDKRLVNAS